MSTFLKYAFLYSHPAGRAAVIRTIQEGLTESGVPCSQKELDGHWTALQSRILKKVRAVDAALDSVRLDGELNCFLYSIDSKPANIFIEIGFLVACVTPSNAFEISKMTGCDKDKLMNKLRDCDGCLHLVCVVSAARKRAPYV